MRFDIIRSDAPFGNSAMKSLVESYFHLVPALLAEPWVRASPTERADHVVSLFRTGARREHVSAMLGVHAGVGVGGSRDGAGGDKRDDARLGKGVIPTHYMANVKLALASEEYRVLKAAVDSEVDEIAREDVPGWEAAQEVRGHRFPAAEEFRSAEDTRLKSAGRQER